MSADLNSVLNTDFDKLFKGQFVVLSDSCVDASFLVHHWVALYAKRDCNVCLLGLTQSFNHYNSVANKFGVNLNSLKEKKKFVFVEGLKMCSEMIMSLANQEIQNHQFQGILQKGSSSSLKELFLAVKCAVEQLPDFTNSQSVVIIDGLSSLLSLGANVKSIVDFMHYLQQLVVPSNDSYGCLVTMVNSDRDVEDEDSELLRRYLFHRAHVCIQAKGLESGYCKDVHGQLDITLKDPACTEPGLPVRKTMQYKVTDKTISMFARGTSAAVL